ncbi:MAG: YhdH/YhfP family quinone oxidoreductase [Calditrichia bacterium]
MENKVFKALVVNAEQGKIRREISKKSVEELPAGEVLIRVRYSSLNYKDALSANGHRGITKSYPHTPGIDAAGEVANSGSSAFRKGQAVLVTGYDLGMNTPGGFGQYIRVPGDWVVALPGNLTPRISMMYGTAGFTAALALHEIRFHKILPEEGPVLITGASGGLGSLAVALFSQQGYRVFALTGKPQAESLLKRLGAAEVVGREFLLGEENRPLTERRWCAAVDTVGGELLSRILASTDYFGCVACCGNAGSYELNTTVYPFILRGIRLIGIDSAHCPMPLRRQIWRNLASEWRISDKILSAIAEECSLYELNGEIEKILAGKQVGRKLINLDA